MNLFNKDDGLDTARSRLRVIYWVVIIFSLLIIAQLVNLHIVRHEELVARAEKQHKSRIDLIPRRGHLLDRHGLVLTENLDDYYAVGVNTDSVANKKTFALQLAQTLGKTVDYYVGRLNLNSPFVYVRRGVSSEMATYLKKQYKGIVRIIPETRRVYPHGQRAGQLLGFVDADGNGKGGVEGKYDDLLAGKKGWRIDLVEGGLSRRRYYDKDLPKEEAVNGSDIQLTIDYPIQAILEEELLNAMGLYNALGASGIVTDPNTGAILAMASTPTFNPNNYSSAIAGSEINRPIMTIYEPGSTYKIIAASILLEKGLASLTTPVNTAPGSISIPGGYKITDHGNNYGTISLKQAMSKSSNVGMIKLSQAVSQDDLYQMMRNYGFGITTGIELPGEQAGIVRQVKEWSGSTKPNVIIGHGISVTMLQMAMAYGAIANGGKLMKPMIIRKILHPDATVELRDQQVVRTVISQRTAGLLNSCLEEVVLTGTGTGAAVDGISIAGKTGTAAKVDPTTRTYSEENYIASFIGYFPSRNPKYLMIVFVDQPQGVHYGGSVAAPVFKRVTERIVDRQPTLRSTGRRGDPNRLVAVPKLETLQRSTAVAKLSQVGLRYTTVGRGEVVHDQYPSATAKVRAGAIVTIVLGPAKNDRQTVVPYLLGRGIRDAVVKASSSGLYVSVSGSGTVQTQTPSAGAVVNYGSKAVIIGEEN